ncbi:Acetyltransferase, GNAT family protein [Sulfitobacter noctilucicola]|nr:Acetyltransferase, GNAT family protein [Sulfitobacter noctilucicola]
MRPAHSTDAGTVGAILTEFAEGTAWLPKLHTGAEDVAHAGAMIDRGWVTVAETEDRVVAFSACNAGDLDALYVASGMRGQGVGGLLLEKLKAAHDNLKLWTFQANTRAHAFYLRHGFVEVARTDGATTDEQLPDIRYEWQRGAT